MMLVRKGVNLYESKDIKMTKLLKVLGFNIFAQAAVNSNNCLLIITHSMVSHTKSSLDVSI